MGSSVILPQPGQPKTGPDATFKTASQPYVASFALTDVAPPSNVYVRPDDQLLIEAFGTLGSTFVNLNIMARLLLVAPDVSGQPDAPPPTPIQQPGPTESQAIKFFTGVMTQSSPTGNVLLRLAEGFLLSVSVTPTANIPRGQFFVRVSLVRAIGGGVFTKVPLFSDCISGIGPVGWPYGRVVSGVEGPGELLTIQVTNPAAGADWSQTVNTQERWRIVSLAATFTASAAAGNRNVQIILDNGASTYWIDDASASIIAATTDTITATTTNVPTGIVTTIQNVVLPPQLIMPGGHRIRSSTVGILAGDTWTNIFLFVERWLDLV